MLRINANKFGLACGITAAIFYVGCVLLMLIVGKEGTVTFFNSLLHGIDVSTVIRMDIPLGEVILGIIGTFFLAWIGGALIIWIYNGMSSKQLKGSDRS